MTCVAFDTKAKKGFFGIFMALCLVLGAQESKKVQEIKYSDKLSEESETTRKNFIGSAALLDSLGVPGNARMLVIDAWSSNIPLILMNRMGHTLLSTSRPDLMRGLNLDYDYVVVQDLYFPSDVVSNYPEILRRLERVGGNGRISIFRKSTAQKTASLAEALGIRHTWRTDSLDFESLTAASLWKNTNQTAEQSVSPTHAGFIGKEIEFGPTLEIPVNETAGSREFDKVLFEGWYFAQKTGDKFQAIATLESNGQTEFYDGYTFRADSAGQWRQFHALFFLPDTVGENQKLKCYIWNPGRTEMYLDDFKVTMCR